MAWACLATSGTELLIFVNDVAADTRINYEMYRAIFTAQIQSDPAKLNEQHFTGQMDPM